MFNSSPTRGPVYRRKKKEEYTEKPNRVDPRSSFEFDENARQIAEENRNKARGNLDGPLGNFLNDDVDAPHFTTKVGKRQSPPRQMSVLQLQQSGNAPRTLPVQQQQGYQLPRDPMSHYPSGPHPKITMPKLDVSKQGMPMELMDLMEIVYTNNAESQRCYLDFRPY